MRGRSLVGVLAAIGCAFVVTACSSSDCGCEQRYRECIDKAPPGAAKADCAREQDDCEQACDQGRSGATGPEAK